MADQVLDEITVTATRPLNIAATGRQPRGIVKINDQVIPGWINWSVSNNAYSEADTFDVTFALQALPKSNDANWFSQQTEIFVEILAGFPKNPDAPLAAELTSWIYGRVDEIEIDVAEQTLHLTGRDLTGCFIDAKLAANYTNQRASDIAIALAQSHDLAYRVAKTKAYVGTYVNIDTTLVHTGRSEWDLLVDLARLEGFVVYVIGQILWFAPDPTSANTAYVLKYQPASDAGPPRANFRRLGLVRNLTVAKGITVTVMSAGAGNPTVRRSYPYAPKEIAPGKSSPYGATTNYSKIAPRGWTPLQCLTEAQRLYNVYIQHEMKLSALLPGDNLLTTQTPIQVSGLSTRFDQIYFPKVVTRTMSKDEGYSMDVQAQSQDPNLAETEPPPDTTGTTDTAPADDVTTGSDATSQ